MRILTWNCNGAFRRKYSLLDQFEADVLVIQECEEPSVGPTDYLNWASNHLWVGRNKSKGLGIFARKSQSLQGLSWPNAGMELFLPTLVNESIQIVGVWTQAGQTSQHSYIGQFWHYLQENRHRLDERTIFCGDFNSNTRWDKPKRRWNHSECVRELEACGLLSLYHLALGEAHGEETAPTFYLHRNRLKPYHIDYVFAHQGLFPEQKIDLSVGDPALWLKHSDHMPLLFDL
jgi:exonuclease III